LDGSQNHITELMPYLAGFVHPALIGLLLVDGSPTGVKTGEEQLKANYTQYITPTWQGSFTLTHDMSASGGFTQDFSMILRVAKVF
jgi:hypothetical protein